MDRSALPPFSIANAYSTLKSQFPSRLDLAFPLSIWQLSCQMSTNFRPLFGIEVERLGRDDKHIVRLSWLNEI